MPTCRKRLKRLKGVMPLSQRPVLDVNYSFTHVSIITYSLAAWYYLDDGGGVSDLPGCAQGTLGFCVR